MFRYLRRLFGRPQPLTATPITTTWTSSGVARSVVTYKHAGESTSDWIDRHFAAVRTAMDTYPPDP